MEKLFNEFSSKDFDRNAKDEDLIRYKQKKTIVSTRIYKINDNLKIFIEKIIKNFNDLKNNMIPNTDNESEKESLHKDFQSILIPFAYLEEYFVNHL